MPDNIEEHLRAIGHRLARNRTNLEIAWEDAHAAAFEAIDAGKSQHRVAELLGVDRMTVRKWVGKR